MDAAELIERTAAAVAEGYRELDLADADGLLLSTYYDGAPEQLAPLALELREGEVTPDVDRDGYQRELGMPEVDRDPPVFELCEALNEHIEHDDDGYVLVEVYWLALAARLHGLLGIPVNATEMFTFRADARRDRAEVAAAVGRREDAGLATAAALALYAAKENTAAAAQLRARTAAGWAPGVRDRRTRR